MTMKSRILIILFAGLLLPAFLFAAQGKQAPTTPQGFFLQAKNAFEKNDLDAAIFNCRMAISMKPDFIDAHYMLGKAYLIRAAKKNRLPVKTYGISSPETRYLKEYVQGRDDLQNAIKHFKETIRLNPEDIDSMLNLAIAQDNFGKEEEAIKMYETTIKFDPISTHARDAYNNLGLLYSARENFKKAKKCYEESLKIDPNFVPAKMNLQRLINLEPKLKK